MNLREMRDVLDRHGLRLSRELGQNFLVEEQQAVRLAERAGVAAGESVIEVGTGLGVLTRALAARAARVVSIEIDAGLVRALTAESLLPDNVELRHADALAVDFRALAAGLPGPTRLVANLPYSVATPLLRQLLDLSDVFVDWSVMIQREVAERLAASPRTKAYGSLSVLHGLTVDVETCAVLRPAAFFPKPSVDSTFVRIRPRRTPLIEPGELRSVERVARAAFSQRRKTISNALRGAGLGGEGGVAAARERIDAALAAAAIDPGARAETLEPERFVALARAFAEQGRS